MNGLNIQKTQFVSVEKYLENKTTNVTILIDRKYNLNTNIQIG